MNPIDEPGHAGAATGPAPDERTEPPFGRFEDLGLSPEVLRALGDMGFTAPMEVQAKTMPLALAGRDLLVQSRTGSGKTAAFGIPIVDRIVDPEARHVQAVILLPTRELALQVASELARVAAHRRIVVVPVYGGAPMGRQIEQLRAGGQIVCGTPGRILDHLRRGTLTLGRVRCAVLDEADEMLSMGFQEDIEDILEHTPAERQTFLFSATIPDGIQRLARRFLRAPEHLKLSADFVGVHEIRHTYYSVSGGSRESDLLRILDFENPKRAIVFCNTRDETGRVAEFLRGRGLEAEAISSDLSQSDREKVMQLMRKGSLRYLVATDVAARGIDLDDVTHVVNFTFPESPEVYIHRTGRTGRAGKHGIAVSLIGPTEVGAFYYLKLLYKIKPEERSLPSEGEIKSRREGDLITGLRAELKGDPGAKWKSLARRLLSALDAERLVAALLEARLGGAARSAAARSQDDGGAREGGARVESVTSGTGTERGGARRERGHDREREPRAREGREYETRGRDPRGREHEPGGGDLRGGEPRASEPRGGEPRTQEPRGGDPRTGEPRGGETPQDSGPVRDRIGAGSVSRGRDVEPRPFGRRDERRDQRRDELRRRDRSRAERRDHRTGLESRGPVDADREPSAGENGGGHEPGPGGAEGRGPRRNEEFMDVWSQGEDGAAPSPAQDRPAPPAGEVTRLYLNLGRKDRAGVEDIIALAAEVGVALEPEDIEVMSTHSYVDAPNPAAVKLVEGLAGRMHEGRSLVCEPAKPRRR
jgi:ATP-dependent RNA helicase DeaD